MRECFDKTWYWRKYKSFENVNFLQWFLLEFISHASLHNAHDEIILIVSSLLFCISSIICCIHHLFVIFP